MSSIEMPLDTAAIMVARGLEAQIRSKIEEIILLEIQPTIKEMADKAARELLGAAHVRMGKSIRDLALQVEVQFGRPE